MNLFDIIVDKISRHPKRIVFPEGTELKVLQAARRFADLKMGVPILLGDQKVIRGIAEREGIDLHRIMILDPIRSADFPMFCRNLERLDRYKKMGIKHPEDIMVKPNYFAAMMLQYGQADALVGGTSGYAGSLMRPLIQLIKPLPGIATITGAMVMEFEDKSVGENGVLFMGDCAVVPEPTVYQLAGIAYKTGMLARQLLGVTPRVAMLSFSSKGSARTPQTERIVSATALARERAKENFVEMEIEGELQADAALVEEIAKMKVGINPVAGKANVLVFPDLNSGNISSKLIQYLTGARAYGQVLLGLSKPAADASRTADVDTIVALAGIVGLQAIEYRRLYPDD